MIDPLSYIANMNIENMNPCLSCLLGIDFSKNLLEILSIFGDLLFAGFGRHGG